MLMPSTSHGTQRLPNDDDDDCYAKKIRNLHRTSCARLCFPCLGSRYHILGYNVYFRSSVLFHSATKNGYTMIRLDEAT